MRSQRLSVYALSTVVLLTAAACGSDDEGEGAGLGPSATLEDGGIVTAPTEGDASVLAPGADATSTTSDAAPPRDASIDAAPAQTFSGEATWYDAHGLNACGMQNPPDFLVAAMNKAQYTKANCGKCVRVKGPSGEVTAKLVDLCPGCKANSLDLSEEAFQRIAKLSAGRVKITWWFTPCP